MASLAVIILTLNEELHIARALAAVSPVAQEVFVIDSGSQDKTTEIARAMGAKVLVHGFINYAKQFQWALDNAPITSEWIMRLDADEIVEPDLANALETRLPSLNSEVTGIRLKRKHIFMDRWIRHGGRYPLVLLRIWRRGKAKIEDRWMDEHMILTEGRAITLDGGFANHNLNDLTFFTTRHNWYATREAVDALSRKYKIRANDNFLTSDAGSAQAAIRRRIKETIYNRIPFWLSSTGYFFYRYVLLGGFLDGREGIIYHFLQAYWYRFLVGAKSFEYERVIRRCNDRNQALTELSRLTGFDLSDSK